MNFKTATNEQINLNNVKKYQWHYFSILISEHKTIIEVYENPSSINEYKPTFVFSDNEEINFDIVITYAIFKEVKFYSYSKYKMTPYFAHTQVDLEKESLLFYYPLDGKKTTRYLYNAIDYTEFTTKSIKNLHWELILNDDSIVCPIGYYYKGSSENRLLPTCIKQNYVSATQTYTFNIDTGFTTTKFIAISVWFYYKNINTELINFATTAFVIQLSGSNVHLKSNDGGNSINLIFSLDTAGWIHAGYTLSVSHNHKLYLHDKL